MQLLVEKGIVTPEEVSTKRHYVEVNHPRVIEIDKEYLQLEELIVNRAERDSKEDTLCKVLANIENATEEEKNKAKEYLDELFPRNKK